VIVDGNTITNAHFYHEKQGAYDEALTISSVTNFEVKNNILDNTETLAFDPNVYGADKLGIDIKESSQNGNVYHNRIRNMNAGGIYIDPWHAGAGGTPTLNHINIYNNYLNDAGLTVGAEQADGICEYINIYNNIIVNAPYRGIEIRKAWGDGLRKNITIYNNTIFGSDPAGGNGGAGIMVTTSHLGSNNSDKPVIIRNNISNFYFPNGGGTVGQIRVADANIAKLVTADHNIVFGPMICSQQYPNCVEIGSRITADASSLFVDPSQYDLHLKPNSPAIGAGFSTPFPLDYEGSSRISNDIGVYQYKSIASIPVTPTITIAPTPTPCVPINGGWSNWSICTSGSQKRTCSNPSPSCGGLNCVGVSDRCCGGGVMCNGSCLLPTN
jgi:hypothetical protein